MEEAEGVAAEVKTVVAEEEILGAVEAVAPVSIKVAIVLPLHVALAQTQSMVISHGTKIKGRAQQRVKTVQPVERNIILPKANSVPKPGKTIKAQIQFI